MPVRVFEARVACTRLEAPYPSSVLITHKTPLLVRLRVMAQDYLMEISIGYRFQHV